MGILVGLEEINTENNSVIQFDVDVGLLESSHTGGRR